MAQNLKDFPIQRTMRLLTFQTLTSVNLQKKALHATGCFQWPATRVSVERFPISRIKYNTLAASLVDRSSVIS